MTIREMIKHSQDGTRPCNKGSRQTERNYEIYLKYINGWSKSELARKYQLSVTRIDQLIGKTKRIIGWYEYCEKNGIKGWN